MSEISGKSRCTVRKCWTFPVPIALNYSTNYSANNKLLVYTGEIRRCTFLSSNQLRNESYLHAKNLRKKYTNFPSSSSGKIWRYLGTYILVFDVLILRLIQKKHIVHGLELMWNHLYNPLHFLIMMMRKIVFISYGNSRIIESEVNNNLFHSCKI